MTDVSLRTRMPCPVCLGTMMEKVRLGGQRQGLEVDYCRRCGGVWFEPGEVQQLRGVQQSELWTKIGARPTGSPTLCHDCHSPLDRSAERCPGCGASNLLDCPDCAHPMGVEAYGGLRLDVCRRCKGVWFDHHELEAIWGAALDRSLQKRKTRRGDQLAGVADDAGDVLLTSLFFAPDLLLYGAYAAGHAVSASAHALSSLPEAAAATPELAASAFEAVGDAAGSVFEAIIEIVTGIFESF
jgi:Zn-finger nucleic acid-binding protein